MKITVKCFALARQLVGDDTVSVELTEGSTVDDLKKELALRFPQMDRVLNSSMIAVDGDYAPGNHPLLGTEEVACIPPVSGG